MDSDLWHQVVYFFIFIFFFLWLHHWLIVGMKLNALQLCVCSYRIGRSPAVLSAFLDDISRFPAFTCHLPGIPGSYGNIIRMFVVAYCEEKQVCVCRLDKIGILCFYCQEHPCFTRESLCHCINALLSCPLLPNKCPPSDFWSRFQVVLSLKHQANRIFHLQNPLDLIICALHSHFRKKLRTCLINWCTHLQLLSWWAGCLQPGKPNIGYSQNI